MTPSSVCQTRQKCRTCLGAYVSRHECNHCCIVAQPSQRVVCSHDREGAVVTTCNLHVWGAFIVDLHGHVGTGKSLLMDLLFAATASNVKHRRRVHYAAFILEIHRYVGLALLRVSVRTVASPLAWNCFRDGSKFTGGSTKIDLLQVIPSGRELELPLCIP